MLHEYDMNINMHILTLLQHACLKCITTCMPHAYYGATHAHMHIIRPCMHVCMYRHTDIHIIGMSRACTVHVTH